MVLFSTTNNIKMRQQTTPVRRAQTNLSSSVLGSLDEHQTFLLRLALVKGRQHAVCILQESLNCNTAKPLHVAVCRAVIDRDLKVDE